jgi:GxxExxY protein
MDADGRRGAGVEETAKEGKGMTEPDEVRSRLDEITKKIIGCAYAVMNELGHGFAEKVYENSMLIELRDAGLRAEQQHRVGVSYRGAPVGDYTADILVEDAVIVEIKAVRAFDDSHVAQCLNYLKGTGLSVCLLVNFGKARVDVKRIVRDF